MAVLHEPTRDDLIAELEASRAEQERAARDRKSLRDRAKRRGVSVQVQAQREWIEANPCGFEIG